MRFETVTMAVFATIRRSVDFRSVLLRGYRAPPYPLFSYLRIQYQFLYYNNFFLLQGKH